VCITAHQCAQVPLVAGALAGLAGFVVGYLMFGRK
jgi:hypothetical protein